MTDSIDIELKTALMRAIGNNLVDDNLAVLNGHILSISNENIFLIEQARRELLGIPEEFNGYLTVKIHKLPDDENFWIELIFEDNNFRKIKPDIAGVYLKIGSYISLLNRDMYQTVMAADRANNTTDSHTRWACIGEIKSLDSEKIQIKGISENNEIITPSDIKIDIIKNPDDSLTLLPHIGGLSSDYIQSKVGQILTTNSNSYLLTEIKDGKYIRGNLGKKPIGAIMKLANIKIPKNEVAKFFKNPNQYIFEGDETPEEFGILIDSGYRVIGIGEPYVGYFGSVPFESPLSKIFFESVDDKPRKEQFREFIEEKLRGKNKEEIEAVSKDIDMAIKNNRLEFELFGTPIKDADFKTVKDILKKYANSKGSTSPTNDPTKGVVVTKPNDDEELNSNTLYKKPIDQIKNDDIETQIALSNSKFNPKSYQISGVNWMIDLYDNNFNGGILADDMGLGKTYQTIIFLDYLLKQKPNCRILIVAPVILLDNWKSEFVAALKDTQHIRLKILKGENLKSHKIQNTTSDNRVYNDFNVKFLLDFDKPNIILTTYETLTNYQVPFAKNEFWNFECVVFDEAHKLKNPNSLQSQAAVAVSDKVKFKLLLTGTPIENELRDIWALFNIFDGSYIGTWKDFKKEFVSDNIDEEKLRKKISKYLLRRFKKDYLKELPQKIEKVREVEMTPSEIDLYRHLHSYGKALEKLHRSKDFSLHTSLVDRNASKNLSDYSKTKELVVLLDEIKSKNEKVIIFVINRLIQDLLRCELQMHFNLAKIGLINGDNNSQSKVKSILDDFKMHDGFGILLLSPLAAGVGLTIVEANHVIHYQRWWNASKEDQASDRAYRIGQTKDVEIHHIIGKSLQLSKPTFDEALHELITLKRRQAGFIVPSTNIKDGELGEKIGEKPSLEDIVDNLQWDEFEKIIYKLYINMDYDCERVAGHNEHGADIVAKKMNEIVAIQCKHSKSRTQDKQAILQLHTESHYWKATEKIAITNTSFNAEAHSLARTHGIRIVERQELLEKLKEYQVI